MKSNLVRSNRALPSQFERLTVAVVVEPSRLVRSMPIGRLPHFANPPEAATLPACSGWFPKPVRGPCSRLCRVLKHSAPAVHRSQRCGETTAVIPRPVVLTAPSSEVHVCHRSPQLAWRVRAATLASSFVVGTCQARRADTLSFPVRRRTFSCWHSRDIRAGRLFLPTRIKPTHSYSAIPLLYINVAKATATIMAVISDPDSSIILRFLTSPLRAPQF